MKILVTKYPGTGEFETFFTDEARKTLESLGEVIYNPHGRPYTDEELRDALEGVDVVFTGWGAYNFSEEVLAKADKLKIIAHTGGSVAQVISEALKKRNVIILCGNRLFAESVAEGTLCYILAAQRNLVKTVNITAEEGWPETYMPNSGLKGKTIGLVGFGMIAENLARILQSFDVKLKIYSGYLSVEKAAQYNAELATLDEIFETCDIISVHSALNDKNYHLINKNHFAKMKDDALIVNTARGAVMVEEELAEELKKGRIRAILDVYEEEPLSMESPLRGLPNAILVPHRGGPTTDVRAMVTIALAGDVKKFMNGDTNLTHQVSYEYGSRMTNEAKFRK